MQKACAFLCLLMKENSVFSRFACDITTHTKRKGVLSMVNVGQQLKVMKNEALESG